LIVFLYLWCFWFLKVLACNKLLTLHSCLCQLILESNDSWCLFYFVMYCRITIARRGCKTRRAYGRRDKKVLYQEKDIQELMCYFFFCSGCCHSKFLWWDPWWGDPDVVFGIYEGITRIKILCYGSMMGWPAQRY